MGYELACPKFSSLLITSPRVMDTKIWIEFNFDDVRNFWPIFDGLCLILRDLNFEDHLPNKNLAPVKK